MNISVEYLKNLNYSEPNAVRFALFKSFGDLAIACPTYFFAKLFSQVSDPKTNTFLYELTHSSNGKQFEDSLGVIHSADLAFVFGAPLLTPTATEEDRQFSAVVMKYWTDFAKYGKPSKEWSPMMTNSTVFAKNLNPNKSLSESHFYYVCELFWRKYFIN